MRYVGLPHPHHAPQVLANSNFQLFMAVRTDGRAGGTHNNLNAPMLYYEYGDLVVSSGFHVFDVFSEWRKWICEELHFNKSGIDTMEADVAYFDVVLRCWVRIPGDRCFSTPFKIAPGYVIIYRGEEPRRIRSVATTHERPGCSVQ